MTETVDQENGKASDRNDFSTIIVSGFDNEAAENSEPGLLGHQGQVLKM